jgi:hypothetical protein
MMAVAAGVYWVLRLAGFHQLFVNDAEGMGALLEIIGTSSVRDLGRMHDSVSALFYPFHNLALGIVAISLTTMLLCFAHFVLTELDNPLAGTWNVDAKPFDDLATK